MPNTMMIRVNEVTRISRVGASDRTVNNKMTVSDCDAACVSLVPSSSVTDSSGTSSSESGGTCNGESMSMPPVGSGGAG